MAGQLWSVPAEGGFLYSDELSDKLRMAVQPLTKFRQLCDAEDGSNKGVGAGENYYWNVYEDLADADNRLNETTPIPEYNFNIRQRSLTVTEFGAAVPFTGKVQTLGAHDVVKIIDKVLKHRCRKAMDAEAFLQFNRTMLRVAPTGGNSTSAVTLTTNGATATTNNVALRKDHVKAISDVMKERNIAPFDGDDYFCISHPTTFRTMKNDLEPVYQYTESGLSHIMNGEVGRFEDVRFIEQNYIPKGGANDSTTFNPRTGVADAWNNGLSSWAFFFGKSLPLASVTVH